MSTNLQVDPHVERRYKIVRYIGGGAYGVVWKAVDRRTKKLVALKKVFDAFTNDTDAQRTYREALLLLNLHHVNIVKLLNIIRSLDDIDLYMVFELQESDVHAVVKAGILQDTQRQYIAYQLIRCTHYLHAKGVIHRDLKPANILVNSDCAIKLADFGLARCYGGPRFGGTAVLNADVAGGIVGMMGATATAAEGNFLMTQVGDNNGRTRQQYQQGKATSFTPPTPQDAFLGGGGAAAADRHTYGDLSSIDGGVHHHHNGVVSPVLPHPAGPTSGGASVPEGGVGIPSIGGVSSHINMTMMHSGFMSSTEVAAVAGGGGHGVYPPVVGGNLYDHSRAVGGGAFGSGTDPLIAGGGGGGVGLPPMSIGNSTAAPPPHQQGGGLPHTTNNNGGAANNNIFNPNFTIPYNANDFPLTDYIATRWYRAPELLCGTNAYTTSIDMWAVGCIIAELFLGTPIFKGASTDDQLQLIICALGAPTEEDLEGWRVATAASVVGRLHQSPLAESGPYSSLYTQLQSLPRDAAELVKLLLCLDPSKRLTAIEALRHPYISVFATPEELFGEEPNTASAMDLATPIVIELDDGVKHTVQEYRTALYEQAATLKTGGE